ncbi:hypothetical protein [Bifidobacterium sp. SO4]|uniref:hypothetical protein n=1 Tax=Bifidobacterium sp. SO4 TaxID=2809030 RepID=UPI001BDC0011|nr:hypothetical protein [Bifidobacterium sp. SO4]MBT1170478.1 hypothetical protein [Bifidobacterium sp. SO4]
MKGERAERRLAAVTLTTLCVVGMACMLAGCAGPATNAGDGSAAGTADGYDLNAHYSAELKQARAQLKEQGDGFAVGILEDGVITQAELAEVNDRIVQCLTDYGYAKDAIDMGELGSMSVHPPSGMTQEESSAWGGSVNQDLQTCETRDGARTIWQLASAVQANPNNDGADIRQTIVDCYVREGLVEQSYTVDDYDRDSREGTGPFSEARRADTGYRQKLEACG